MATPPATPSLAGAVVIDANIAIAISSKESGREKRATVELQALATAGNLLYAPGVIVAETLFVLCRKHQDGILSAADYTHAIADFEHLLAAVLPPRDGDFALVSRAQHIGSGYGCSRSADGLYIALAEALSVITPTVLLTFDTDLPSQAAANAPTVTVHVLAP